MRLLVLIGAATLALSGCISVTEAPTREVVVERIERVEVEDVARVDDSSLIYVRSVRLAADDVPALASFYEKAFGMKEIRRLEFPNLIEIIMNSGATKAEAGLNPHAPLVIMTRPENHDGGSMAVLIMSVPDMDAAIAAFEDAGGKLLRPVARLEDGTTYAFLTDPEGNQVEFLLAR